jgi:chitin disaccharide deacetylase
MAETGTESRRLIVMADDFGIGPETSRAILDLAAQGRVTGTVLLVNSPFAEDAVLRWKRSGITLEIGWHPNLTLDRPVSPPEKVPSLIRANGTFYPLGSFMKRMMLGKVRISEIESELRAQYDRFIELMGHTPAFLNGHHHVHVFKPVAEALAAILAEERVRPYVRRVREPRSMLWRIPGARLKRLMLSLIARRTAGIYDSLGCPSNDCLAGITNPVCVTDAAYFTRWLACAPGRVVELTCHPGYWDDSLHGRDCEVGDGLVQRRVDELAGISRANFMEVCREARLQLTSVGELLGRQATGVQRAA